MEPTETIRILQVEDNPADADLLAEMLELASQRTFHIRVARSLAEGRELAHAEPFDAFLLDLNLPDSENQDTVIAWQREAAVGPLVVLTGEADNEAGRLAIQHGAQDFLPKDMLEPELLSRTIGHAIERWRLEQRQRAVQKQLEQQTQQLTAVLGTAGDAVITADDQGIIHYFNPAAETMFGYSAPAMVGEKINRLMPEPHASQHGDYLARYERTGERRIIGQGRELEACRADGSHFPIEINITDTGLTAPRLFVAIIRDISERKAAQQALEEAQANLNRAQGIARLGSWELDPESGVMWWSDQIYRILGEPPQSVSPDRSTFLAYVHPDDRETVEQGLNEALQGVPFAIEHQVCPSDGEVRWVYQEGQVALDDHANPRRMTGILQDVTERRQLQDAVRQERDTARALINSLPGVFYMINAEQRFQLWNRNMETVTGRTPQELASLAAQAIMVPEDQDSAVSAMEQGFNEGATRLEARLQTPDGANPPYDFSGYRVNLDGEPVLIGLGIDISRRVGLEDELRRLATTDTLTGLANRRHFLEQAESELGRMRRYGNAMSLLMLDVDHFKHVNDTYGHDVGDRALQMLAETARGTLRDQETIGRLGGEEFAVLLPETGTDGALQAAERLRARVAGAALDQGEGSLGITISIGIADWRGPEDTLEALLTRADEALYAAKDAGRNRAVSA